MKLGNYSFERKDHLAYGDVVLLTQEENKKEFPYPLYVGCAAAIPNDAAQKAQVIWANRESLDAFETFSKTEDFLYLVQKPFIVHCGGKNGSPKSFRKRPAGIRKNRTFSTY